MVFISIPEILVVYMLADSFIDNKIEIKNILKISLLFAIICYTIKNTFYGGIDTILILFVVALLYYFYSKISLLNSFIVISISYGIKFVSEFIIVSSGNALEISIEQMLNNRFLKIIFFYMTLIIPLMIIKLNTSKKVKLFNLQVKRNVIIAKNKLVMYGLVIVGSATIIIIGVLVSICKINNYRTFETYEILLIGMVVISVVSLIIIVLSLEKRQQITLIEKNLMAINLKQMEETVDLLRVQKHDMMNHLQIILMQINRGNHKNAKQYILGLAEDVKNIGLVFNTGNDYIDAILNFKNRRCIDSEIVLTACIDSLLEDTTFDDTQLSSIFLNIIDNAIDELKNSVKEYKYIHVDTFYYNNTHVISIKNNGAKIGDTEKIFEMGVSSKGEDRGYGLYGIRHLLLKHKSKIYAISDHDETEFVIEIPKRRGR